MKTFLFQQLPSGDKAKWEVGNKAENRNKNRFVNIRACTQSFRIDYVLFICMCFIETLVKRVKTFHFSDDHSRVALKIEDGDIHSDYINADFITGYKDKPKVYVAAQGTV